ncbi:hypothetical protein [Micromonospora maritima]|uniref:hypothetical protein n=1 Tax=Micromonospora maritima TaxID=986711 RepID=UPI0037B6F94A
MRDYECVARAIADAVTSTSTERWQPSAGALSSAYELDGADGSPSPEPGRAAGARRSVIHRQRTPAAAVRQRPVAEDPMADALRGAEDSGRPVSRRNGLRTA